MREILINSNNNKIMVFLHHLISDIDDCQDCIRQRNQNNDLIQIYQKLQLVDQKTLSLKQSIKLHQSNLFQSQNNIEKFHQQISQLKFNKNQFDGKQMAKIGIQLYADLLSNKNKTQLQKENQRLKTIIKQIYKKKETKNIHKIQNQQQKLPEEKITTLKISQQQTQAIQWFKSGQRNDDKIKSSKNTYFTQTAMGKSSFQIFSTKSSFNMTKRKSLDKKDFQELNLWLFEDKNQVLEKELYQKSKTQLKATNVSMWLSNLRNVSNKMNNSKIVQDNNKQTFKNSFFGFESKHLESIKQRNLSSNYKKLNYNGQNPINPQLQQKLKKLKNNRKGSVLPAILKK